MPSKSAFLVLVMLLSLMVAPVAQTADPPEPNYSSLIRDIEAIDDANV